MREAIITGAPGGGGDGDDERPVRNAGGPPPETEEEKLRPQKLSEVVGQRSVADRLSIALSASKKRGEPLPHILFDGPPGLGKTTFATVLHNELGVELNMTSGPALDKKMDVMPYLTNASEGSILFIDEIHRLPKTVEEFIYPVMEDFRVDVVLGEGMSARTINLPLKKFTIIGATTRSGMLSGPLRDRFHMHEHLEYYDVDDLARIVSINATKLKTTITPDAAWELARRSRGTPRLANARLRWVRDFATARADGNITLPIAEDALAMQDIDVEGMDKQDRRYLETLIRVFRGGPTGAEALAATMSVAADTLEDEVEPYLLRRHYIVRTSRGRKATAKAYRHLGMVEPEPEDTDLNLFDQRRLFE
ncbi:Holliday junction branch migration DNA helicase RuvB [Tundrisphaera sp. TA3]|uniref:Holliday junction branch migration DNA helicase RuvB n=1 Tax=Tundrisphaera sp. TA3 TaxID=3435775 RepID=UPI003EBF3A99